MRQLHFHSNQLSQSRRYTADLILPDYPRDSNGLIDRTAMIKALLWEEYGVVNAENVSVQAFTEKIMEKQVAGKCRLTLLQFVFTKNTDTHTVPMMLFEPYAVLHPKTVVQISFDEQVPNKYCPIEELMDRGIALAYVYYGHITADNDDFEDGLARFLCDRADPHSAGKISVWSYMLQRIADHLLEKEYTTSDRLYVTGHSRLGKTALLTAVIDERFAGVCVNNSGCCGAAISREKTGETIADICRVFPYWFCTHFHQYAGHEDKLPFDQHWLGACVAPRKLCINTALEDTWADTDAQYLFAEAVSEAYFQRGVVGLEPLDHILPDGCATRAGNIAFLKRYGTHFFSREDWNFFLDFIQK